VAAKPSMMNDNPNIKYYWEDLPVGHVMELGSISPTLHDTMAFARQFDPQPFHLDEEAARQSLFGRISASGWHTCALCMRVTVDNFLRHSSSLGSPGLEKLQWLKPVHPGDVLSVRHTITESRPMASKPTVGIVRGLWEVFNQQGEKVLHMEGYGMFRRRHAAPTNKEL
jgi:acyl dehydratase